MLDQIQGRMTIIKHHLLQQFLLIGILFASDLKRVLVAPTRINVTTFNSERFVRQADQPLM